MTNIPTDELPKEIYTKEDFEKAKKEFEKTPSKSNFLTIKFDYNFEIIVSYDQGVKFIECLKNAERLSTGKNYNNKLIIPIDTDNIKITTLSYNEYAQCKIAMLLNVNYKELNKPNE